jgi:hypothetical protein
MNYKHNVCIFSPEDGEWVFFSEMLVSTCESIWHHNPGEQHCLAIFDLLEDIRKLENGVIIQGK